jgi:alpha-glucosidase
VSYALVASPRGDSFSVVESKDSLELETSGTRLHISKYPIRFSFYTLEGVLINSDDPSFGTSWIGNEVTTYKTIQPDEKFIGLGEKTGNLNRRGKAYTHWNTDCFGYGVDADPLYLSTPFYIGIHSGLCYGIFMDNTHKSVVSFGASNRRCMYFSAADGGMDYYFIGACSVPEILSHYGFLTGRMELPPLWSLGFQQCRYSYYPQAEPLNVARTFREKKIPCDVIYLDIHYMDAYKVFTWHPDRFPDPAGYVKTLSEQGFHTVVILDPGVKTEKGYAPYDEALSKDLFVKFPDGEVYEGQVWPGWSAFPDFTLPQAREWWADNLQLLTRLGIDGFWNDMNEPAAWGQHLPENIEFAYEGEGATHVKARNVYGMQMARSTREGAVAHLKKRPFVLTRAGFSGIQRYAAVWTGDNTASDEHMLLGVRLVNAMGLAGVAHAGYDVGGFAGTCTPALYARWVAIGAFSPFFRAHAMINSRDSEPWSFGEETEDIARNYITLRYKLMPYLYSSFFEAAQTGMPVQRSLAIDYTHDESIYLEAFQNQYGFGKNLLVCPAGSAKEFQKVYLPKGKWYDFFSDETYEGGRELVKELFSDTLPVYVKAGGILCMQSPLQHLGEKPEPTLMLHLYAGADGTFDYYEDDGESFAYRNGNYYLRRLSYSESGQQLSFGEIQGNYASHFTEVKIFFHGFSGFPAVVKQGETTLAVHKEELMHMQAISDFDPFGASLRVHACIPDIPVVCCKNLSNAFKITWN